MKIPNFNKVSGAVGLMRKAKTFFRYLDATMKTIDFAIEQFSSISDENNELQVNTAPAPVAVESPAPNEE